MAIKNSVLVATYNYLKDQGIMLGTRLSPLYAKDYFLEIAKGNIKGTTHIEKFGNKEDVGTDWSVIWSGNSPYTGFNATTAEPVNISSTSIEDSITGTGLRKVRLYGLGDGYISQTEELELDGTNAVTSTLSFIRLDRIWGYEDNEIASNRENIGVITATQSITPDITFAIIPIGHNSTMMALYTVPAGKTAYIYSRTATIANKQTATVEVRFKQRNYGSVFRVGGVAGLNSSGTGLASLNFKVPICLAEKTDFFLEAAASSSCGVSSYITIVLEDN